MGGSKREKEIIALIKKLRTTPGRVGIKPSKRHKDKTKYTRKAKHARAGKD